MNRTASFILVFLFTLSAGYASDLAPSPEEAAGHEEAVSSEEAANPKERVAPRLKRLWTANYHSHWFLLGGLKISRRLVDAQTAVSAFVGQSVVSGCGVQAADCDQEIALNAGLRRYLSEAAFSFYTGMNLHWSPRGSREISGATFIDLSLGFNHQNAGSFNWGLGYSFFIYDGDPEGINLSYQGWLLSEFGWSF